ncbi:hypothetical protein [Halorarum salinum]|uniref:hypothetical protein n=1 Tax=Halorarum salinum TaxID=2743089 RepID=UPI001FE68B8E|nr:hypothetical protein [Halobaculum salinum]
MAALQVPGKQALYDVEYGETAAFVHGDGCLYVNDRKRFDDGTVEPTDVPGLKRELAGLLSNVEDPETGAAVLEAFDGDEVQTPLTDDVFTDAETKAAGHRSEGILLAHGPDIGAGCGPSDATVVDVVPTVLHLRGEPVPAAADGRVLSELVAADSPAADAPVQPRTRERGRRRRERRGRTAPSGARLRRVIGASRRGIQAVRSRPADEAVGHPALATVVELRERIDLLGPELDPLRPGLDRELRRRR